MKPPPLHDPGWEHRRSGILPRKGISIFNNVAYFIAAGSRSYGDVAYFIAAGSRSYGDVAYFIAAESLQSIVNSFMEQQWFAN